jgi:serine protein kinase
VAFLYDLLGATQEHKIKPKKFAQTDIDEVIIGHTNEAEYRKLLNNEFMEALRDRTVKIDIPYITKMSEEIKIYAKDFKPRTSAASTSPRTPSRWRRCGRCSPGSRSPRSTNLTLLQKLKLYDGKTLPGFTQDNVKELRKEANREGMDGISPRYVQDKISNAWSASGARASINPFMVLNELEAACAPLADLQRGAAQALPRALGVVKQEYEDIVKNEVQRAISADEEAIAKLCANYIDNVKAYTQKEKVKNKYTGQDEEPDERLMRSIEEKIDIPESRKDDFRREIMNYIGALAIEGKKFDYKTNERLHKALELKLFEDQKDSIKLTSAGLQRRRQGDPGEDRRRQAPAHQELRLQRGLGHRRAQLRRQHLRPRRRAERRRLLSPARRRLSPTYASHPGNRPRRGARRAAHATGRLTGPNARTGRGCRPGSSRGGAALASSPPVTDPSSSASAVSAIRSFVIARTSRG